MIKKWNIFYQKKKRQYSAVRYPRHSPLWSFWPFQIPVLLFWNDQPASFQRNDEKFAIFVHRLNSWSSGGVRNEDLSTHQVPGTRWKSAHLTGECASQLSQLSQEMAWKPLRLMKVEVDQVVLKVSEHIGSTQFWPPVQFGRCHVTLAQCYTHNFPDMSGPTRSHKFIGAQPIPYHLQEIYHDSIYCSGIYHNNP